MGPDSMRGILPQTPMALLVIKEQVSNTWAIYLHMFQLPQNQITLQYMHNHSHIPGKCRGTGLTRAVCHHHFQHHGILFRWDLTHPCLNIYKCIRQPLHVFSWRPPRDAKNCQAPNDKCEQQWSHAHFGVTPTTMHTGTNQKAQQSCGSGTNRE